MAMPAGQERSGFAAAIAVWRRRKWLALSIFVGVVTAVTSVVAFQPDVYQATATVLVERQQVPENFVQSTVTSGIDARLQSITQQIMSSPRLESLINRFSLYTDLRQRVPLEQVMTRVRQNIHVEQQGAQQQPPPRGPQGNTIIAFTISYSGGDAQQVAQVANALASFYIEENLKVREQQAAGTAEFLSLQLEQTKAALETQEKRLSQFKE